MNSPLCILEVQDSPQGGSRGRILVHRELEEAPVLDVAMRMVRVPVRASGCEFIVLGALEDGGSGDGGGCHAYVFDGVKAEIRRLPIPVDVDCLVFGHPRTERPRNRRRYRLAVVPMAEPRLLAEGDNDDVRLLDLEGNELASANVGPCGEYSTDGDSIVFLSRRGTAIVRAGGRPGPSGSTLVRRLHPTDLRSAGLQLYELATLGFALRSLVGPISVFEGVDVQQIFWTGSQMLVCRGYDPDFRRSQKCYLVDRDGGWRYVDGLEEAWLHLPGEDDVFVGLNMPSEGSDATWRRWRISRQGSRKSGVVELACRIRDWPLSSTVQNGAPLLWFNNMLLPDERPGCWWHYDVGRDSLRFVPDLPMAKGTASGD